MKKTSSGEAENFRQRQLDAFDDAANGDPSALIAEASEYAKIIANHIADLFSTALDLADELGNTPPTPSQKYLIQLRKVVGQLHDRFPKVFANKLPSRDAPLPSIPATIAIEIHELIFDTAFEIVDYRKFISTKVGEA